MRIWNIDIHKIIKHVIPHFLQKNAMSNVWITPDNFIWFTPTGQAWGSQTSDRHLGWLRALLHPLQLLINSFLEVVHDSFYKVSITGQVIYLEHLLNDKLDSTSRRIYITDGTLVVPPYIYKKSESKPVRYIYKKSENKPSWYLYDSEAYGSQTVKFIIYVPTTMVIDDTLTNLITALINPYRRAGTIFEIKHP